MEQEYLQFNYPNTSKDYKLLIELMKTKRIVCFVKYRNSSKVYDVCATRPVFSNDSLEVGARGIGYISAFEINGNSLEEDFIKQCEDLDLSFLI